MHISLFKYEEASASPEDNATLRCRTQREYCDLAGQLVTGMSARTQGRFRQWHLRGVSLLGRCGVGAREREDLGSVVRLRVWKG
jgi:hypothetical protein